MPLLFRYQYTAMAWLWRVGGSFSPQARTLLYALRMIGDHLPMDVYLLSRYLVFLLFVRYTFLLRSACSFLCFEVLLFYSTPLSSLKIYMLHIYDFNMCLELISCHLLLFFSFFFKRFFAALWCSQVPILEVTDHLADLVGYGMFFICLFLAFFSSPFIYGLLFFVCFLILSFRQAAGASRLTTGALSIAGKGAQITGKTIVYAGKGVMKLPPRRGVKQLVSTTMLRIPAAAASPSLSNVAVGALRGVGATTTAAVVLTNNLLDNKNHEKFRRMGKLTTALAGAVGRAKQKLVLANQLRHKL